MACGLADGCIPAAAQLPLWEAMGQQHFANAAQIEQMVAEKFIAADAEKTCARAEIEHYFSLPTVADIVAALELSDSEWALATANLLRKRSPLMLSVVLEQVRRARTMTLTDDLRMERGLVRHCFHLHPGQSETLEGIRALAVDKDQLPHWKPARIEDVTETLVAPFFESPWPVHAHPLAALGRTEAAQSV